MYMPVLVVCSHQGYKSSTDLLWKRDITVLYASLMNYYVITGRRF